MPTLSPIFVTGGSGFLGRRLITYLRERGHTVRALARSDGAVAAVRDAGAAEVRGDLDDVAALTAGMQGCQTIYHAAAKAEDWGPAEEFHRINVIGTRNVLAAARQAGAGPVVHVSTEAVLLGGPPIHDADESWPRPERPLCLYALTKGLAEDEVLRAAASGQHAVIVRPRLIWGRGDGTVLPRLCDMVRKGQFAWIDGGRYRTSTCHVDNVCEGMLLAAERGRSGETYFLTDGPPVEFRSFITAMLATQGVEPGSRVLPRWLAEAIAFAGETSSRWLGVPRRPPLTRMAVNLLDVTVNDAKARRELGYQALVGQDAGLAEMR